SNVRSDRLSRLRKKGPLVSSGPFAFLSFGKSALREGDIERDIDGLQRLGDWAAYLRLLSNLTQLRFIDAGHTCVEFESAPCNLKPATRCRLNLDLRCGLQGFCGRAVLCQHVCELHGEAASTCCGNQLFRVGPGATRFVLEASLKRKRCFVECRSLGVQRARALR